MKHEDAIQNVAVAVIQEAVDLIVDCYPGINLEVWMNQVNEIFGPNHSSLSPSK
jgi:hypothetical protein